MATCIWQQAPFAKRVVSKCFTPLVQPLVAAGLWPKEFFSFCKVARNVIHNFSGPKGDLIGQFSLCITCAHVRPTCRNGVAAQIR